MQKKKHPLNFKMADDNLKIDLNTIRHQFINSS